MRRKPHKVFQRYTPALIVFVIFSLFALNPTAESTIPGNNTNPDLLQFTSGRHILSFQSEGVYVASPDHMLKVAFQNALKVKPVAESSQFSGKKAHPLTRVTYPDLWNGISLTYDRINEGILRSTYIIQPGARVEDIRLQYNNPVEIDGKGCLHFKYPHGEMTESAPVAWQDIDGKKVPVKVAFKKLGKQDLGFNIGTFNKGYSLIIDPTLEWNTFLGSSNTDMGYGLAVDATGNVYITGESGATWGSPTRNHSGGKDAFVAKLNNSGLLQWNTFLGSSGDDFGYGLSLDTNGNVYVTGYSYATWGTPIRTFSGGSDAFVAKLNNSGVLSWNTFLGSSGNDSGYGLLLDTIGNVYITGESGATWGSPIRNHSGATDAFVAKLNNGGVLQWSTFLGGPSNDFAGKLALDNNNNIYVIGSSYTTWGTPIRTFSGGSDAFVAKLNSSGVLSWNTFLGSSGNDSGYGLGLDTIGNVYITGESGATWGSPVRKHSGATDAFVAKLNNGGFLQWNTFLGSSNTEMGYGLAVDAPGNVYVTGESGATWGSPTRNHSGGKDAFVAKLNNSGLLQWNTFLGSSGNDFGYGLSLDAHGNVYITGSSYAAWGSPIRLFSGGDDAFICKLSGSTGNPVPSISNLSPTSATAGGMQFTLTVTGTDFVNGVVVRWNGNDRTTAFVSVTRLTAAILSADITNAGTYPVTVVNPAPGGGASNAVDFTINAKPTVSTGLATNVTLYLATLNGMVNPNGAPTDYYFQWGLTTSYGSSTPTYSAGSDWVGIPVSFNLSNLNPGETYHYRLVATNSLGTTYSLDQSFKTLIPNAFLFLPLIQR